MDRDMAMLLGHIPHHGCDLNHVEDSAARRAPLVFDFTPPAISIRKASRLPLERDPLQGKLLTVQATMPAAPLAPSAPQADDLGPLFASKDRTQQIHLSVAPAEDRAPEADR